MLDVDDLSVEPDLGGLSGCLAAQCVEVDIDIFQVFWLSV
jgi:hypothetical protein